MSDHDEQLDVDEDTPATADVADFDAFFAEQAAGRPGAVLQLYGRTYQLPDSLPLMFTLQMERLQASADPDDIRAMLRTLVGEDALDNWAAAGMTDRQFGTVLIWAAANVRRAGSVSMARAAELHDQQAGAAAKGKASAPNRAARRKGKKKASRPAGSGARY